MRWSMALQAYDFEVEYKPGREHLNADALSRQADVDDSPSSEEGGNVKDIEPDRPDRADSSSQPSLVKEQIDN